MGRTTKTVSTTLSGLPTFLLGLACIAAVPLALSIAFTASNSGLDNLPVAELMALLAYVAGGATVWGLFVRPLQSRSDRFARARDEA